MFMHIFIKYTVIFVYIANDLTKIEGLNLLFPQKNIICSRHLTYPMAVLSFIVQFSEPVCNQMLQVSWLSLLMNDKFWNLIRSTRQYL